MTAQQVQCSFVYVWAVSARVNSGAFSGVRFPLATVGSLRRAAPRSPSRLSFPKGRKKSDEKSRANACNSYFNALELAHQVSVKIPYVTMNSQPDQSLRSYISRVCPTPDPPHLFNRIINHILNKLQRRIRIS